MPDDDEPRRIGTDYCVNVRDEGEHHWRTEWFKTAAARREWVMSRGSHAYVGRMWEEPRYGE